jgi:hypothetical protein
VTQWSAKIRNGNAPYSVHFALPSTANLGRFGRREVTAKNEEMGYDTNPFGKASRRRSRRVPRAPKNGASPPKPKLDLGFDVCARSFGHYPWDDWERHALAHGLDADLAGQARLLIREAYNHGWEGWLQSLCGWSDDGQALLAFALRSPVKARWCFSRLMETDGLAWRHASQDEGMEVGLLAAEHAARAFGASQRNRQPRRKSCRASPKLNCNGSSARCRWRCCAGTTASS